MKVFGILLFIAISTVCTAQSGTGISGKWLMYKVVQSGKDVTSEHNPYHERYLELNTDQTFESGGRPYGMNTGKYIFDAKESTLFLDSDTGPEDDSQWRVSIQGDTMHWQGYGSEWANDFEIIQLREKL